MKLYSGRVGRGTHVIGRERDGGRECVLDVQLGVAEVSKRDVFEACGVVACQAEDKSPCEVCAGCEAGGCGELGMVCCCDESRRTGVDSVSDFGRAVASASHMLVGLGAETRRAGTCFARRRARDGDASLFSIGPLSSLSSLDGLTEELSSVRSWSDPPSLSSSSRRRGAFSVWRAGRTCSPIRRRARGEVFRAEATDEDEFSMLCGVQLPERRSSWREAS